MVFKKTKIRCYSKYFYKFGFLQNEISIFGGNQLRPNIHIKDMVDSYFKVIEAESSLIDLEIFNVGNITKVLTILHLLSKTILIKKYL